MHDYYVFMDTIVIHKDESKYERYSVLIICY